MELNKAEQRLGQFYVPTYVIKVNGKDLLSDFSLAVTSVEVNLKQRAAGRFSFTVENAFDWEAREFVTLHDESRIDLRDYFEFGTPIEISLGYVDRARLKPILKGKITEISTRFAETGTPSLSVSGYDGLHPLTIGKNTCHWERKRDSEIVSDIADKHGLSPTVVQTNPVKRRVDQNQMSDFRFIEKLAENNGVIFHVNNNKLFFGPRNNDRSNVLQLTWGKDLMSFSPEVKLAEQVTEVEVYGRSAERGEQIIGRASRGDESGRDTGRQSGAEHVTRALGNNARMRVRAAVHTQEEADSLARAILEERSEKFVEGSGESIGITEIVPDMNLALDGLGRAFNKNYYVKESTHKIDSSGYRTTFNVEETTL